MNKFYRDGAKIIQWLAEKLDFFDVYDMKWGYFEWELRTLKVLLCCFLSYVNKDMIWGFQKSYFSLSQLKRLQKCDLSKLEFQKNCLMHQPFTL